MTRVARGAAKASMVEGGVRCKHQGEEEESTSQMGGRRVVGAQPTNRLTKPENSSRIKKMDFVSRIASNVSHFCISEIKLWSLLAECNA